MIALLFLNKDKVNPPAFFSWLEVLTGKRHCEVVVLESEKVNILIKVKEAFCKTLCV